MTKNINEQCDVAIIGSGPAGLSAAITLKKAGINNIAIIERETQAGGIPRHCGHPPFGFQEYKKIVSGPAYAKMNVSRVLKLGINIRVKTTVTALGKNGALSLTSSQGITELKAKKVIIATGARETPRSARFVSGGRAPGIYTTGTLQSLVYLKDKIPFNRPVIVGTEVVSFSALMTCKSMGIKPVAMIEEKTKPSVRWPIYYGAAFFGVKIMSQLRIKRIIAENRVTAVELEHADGTTRTVDCDGVLFTGRFTPESTLVRMSHLKLDERTGSPSTDADGRCSDPAYFAAGNVRQLPPVEGVDWLFYSKKNPPNAVNTSGVCWDQGRRVAEIILAENKQTTTGF